MVAMATGGPVATRGLAPVAVQDPVATAPTVVAVAAVGTRQVVQAVMAPHPHSIQAALTPTVVAVVVVLAMVT